MNCELAQEQIADYIENRVDAPLRVVLEHHLAECSPCRKEVEGTRELVLLFQRLPQLEPPPGFRAGILAKIADAPARRSTVWMDRWSVPLNRNRVQIAGLAFAAVVAGLLFTQPSFHGSGTLGLNPDLHFPMVAPVREASVLPGSPLSLEGRSVSNLRVGKVIEMEVVLQPSIALRNGKVFLPNVAGSQRNGLVCDTEGISTERGRVLWQGSLQPGEPLRLPLRFHATQSGVHHVLLNVEGDHQNYHRLLLIPVYKDALPNFIPRLQGEWSTSETLEQVARQLGVVIATDLTHERSQVVDLPLTKAHMAIQEIAAQRGMNLAASNGIYNVYSTSPPNP